MSRKTGDKPLRIIRASEIGQYAYCARAWWLTNIMGVPSANTRELAQGEVAHQRHGRMVWTAGMLRVVALILFVVALALALYAILLAR